MVKKQKMFMYLCVCLVLNPVLPTAENLPTATAYAKTFDSKVKSDKKTKKKKKEKKPLTARQKTFRSAVRQKIMRRFEKKLNRITKWWWPDGRKLKTCYRWFKGCRYIHPTFYPSSGSRYNGWDIRAANEMLIRKRGICFNYACAFAFFARAIGYKVRVVVGTAHGMTGGRGIHCWVEIDGKIYDPEREYCWHRSNSFYRMSYYNNSYGYQVSYKI